MPVVPVGCVVESWRGTRQLSLTRLLDGCEIETLTGDPAKHAGVLLRHAGSAAGAVDATVVETAIRRGGAIVTSDRADIAQLSSSARRRVQIIDI